jgi:hypothetical protein
MGVLLGQIIALPSLLASLVETWMNLYDESYDKHLTNMTQPKLHYC